MKAAQNGCVAAQFNVAQRYLHGDYLQADDHKAAYWGAQAAANGYPQGSTLLGNCYRLGRGVDVDLLRAARLYVTGARGSDAVAHGNLSDFRDELEGLALARSAVAALITATLYAEGLGGEIDRPLAKAWLDMLDTSPTTELDVDDQNAICQLQKELDETLDAERLRRSARDLDELRRRQGQPGDNST